MSIQLVTLKCQRCGYKWIPRKQDSRQECAKCRHCLKCGKRHVRCKG